MSNWKTFTNGIIRENPTLVLVLGTCPTIAVTTMVANGIGMGIAAAFVLICSNVVISMLRKIIPDTVRIPCYIIVIAGFVTIVQFIVQAFAPALNDALGVFLPLIVVNCIILGRAEMFANKNGVLASALDGLGMGIGFTLALILMSTVREILGAGTWLGIRVLPESVDPIAVFGLAPGGFFVFGLLVAAVAIITKGKVSHKEASGCTACPFAGQCVKASEGGAK
ncbi:MAG TPA: electron transport complex subunit E [Oscillospiraceae bacterium]|nr:electron transport complex subunit E [Oscillospiraceae bacterium]HNW04826.1 electron transport complex subunit E [Oscillospiraceae bacterium]HPW00826.1 electron transport complex subunit E [Oscillospiraceae bacterium]